MANIPNPGYMMTMCCPRGLSVISGVANVPDEPSSATYTKEEDGTDHKIVESFRPILMNLEHFMLVYYASLVRSGICFPTKIYTKTPRLKYMAKKLRRGKPRYLHMQKKMPSHIMQSFKQRLQEP